MTTWNTQVTVDASDPAAEDQLNAARVASGATETDETFRAAVVGAYALLGQFDGYAQVNMSGYVAETADGTVHGFGVSVVPTAKPQEAAPALRGGAPSDGYTDSY